MDLGSQSVNGLLASIAAKQPTPGGGAVAGILAALSTSLGQMVLAYAEGKKEFSDHATLHDDCASLLRAASDEALVLAEADADAYAALHVLWKLDRNDPTRVAQWNETLQNAIDVPMRTIDLSNRILVTLQKLVGKTSAMLVSDLVIAAILAEAAARSARLNVEVNVQQLDEGNSRTAMQERATSLLAECKTISEAIENSCGI